MKKILSAIFVILLIAITACQQNVKKSGEGSMVQSKNVETGTQASQATNTGDSAVDSVGNDLNSVNNDEKDLGTENLSDLDSGFSDVQNI